MNQLITSFFNFLPEPYALYLQKQLSYAGYNASESMFYLVAWKLLSVIAALVFFLVVPPVILCPIAVLSFLLPDLFLYAKVKKRQAEIAAALPQAIDIMLLGVDAGLSLDATLQRIAADRAVYSDALNAELARLGRDILLGMDRERAYLDLYERTGVEELKSFGAALNQSGKMGLSIGKILRAQSEFTRMRRSQKAEEKAAKLPIWMAFPLWFCIMPSLLLILLGPSMLLFFQQLRSP